MGRSIGKAVTAENERCDPWPLRRRPESLQNPASFLRSLAPGRRLGTSGEGGDAGWNIVHIQCQNPLTVERRVTVQRYNNDLQVSGRKASQLSCGDKSLATLDSRLYQELRRRADLPRKCLEEG
jgi:hypothetical protein